MTNMTRGTLVRLKNGDKRRMALVTATIPGIRGGRYLDRLLGGFSTWNTRALEIVPTTSPLRRYVTSTPTRTTT